MGAPRADALAPAAAVARLCRPDAPEIWSPLTGDGLLVVDCSVGGPPPDADALAAAAKTLRRLPSPSVGVTGPSPGPAGGALAPHLDLLVEDAAGLAEIRATVERRPLASMALVQLLRHGEARDTEAGLVAESLVYATLQAGPEFSAWLASRKAPSPAAPERGPAVRVNRELDRLQLRLNRPRRHNAFSTEIRDALCEALTLALSDDSIREVTLSGEGASFSSGGDLSEFGTHPDPATAHAVRSTRNPARLLADCAARTSVFVHGACVGAGVELPAFARRVVARDDAWFQLPEVAMGLVPGAGGTVSLPRRIGRQRTGWLALTGRRIDARTALGWGLVDELCEADGP